MEYFIYIVLGIILGLVVSNTAILMRLTFNLITKEDDAKYKGHYACKKCGESMDFSTQTPVEYCPFCGEKYEEN